MNRYFVTYGVKFATEVEVPEGQNLEDVLLDIVIPENDESTYCDNSYEVYEVKKIK